MSVIDRIKQINQYKGISVRQFCIEVGIANGYLDKVKDVGSEKLLKILNRYPEISPEWLLTGKGSMLKNDQKSDSGCDDSGNKDLTRELIKEIGDLRQQLGEQINENTHLHDRNMQLQAEINELKKKEQNKSIQRHPVHRSTDIAAESEEQYK